MKQYIPYLSFLLLLSCKTKTVELKVLQGNAFGTTYTLQYFSNTNFETKKGIDSIINRVNKSVSTYIYNSDISKINRGDTTIVVDSIFKEVYRISKSVYENSNGYFDPTVGILRNAYGFGDIKPLKKIDSFTLDSLRRYVGFTKVKILRDGTVYKKYPQVYFDFNAVAKGYGIDLIGNYLESKKVKNYILELGGEVLAKGEHLLKQKKWVAGIEAIDSELENRNATVFVKLKNKAMASSGNYRKFRIDSVSGKKYVHTINPHTAKAVQGDVTSATVVASTCANADAYATAFMAMGIENSKKMLQNISTIEAYLTYTDLNNDHKVFITEGFKKIINKQ